MNRETQQAILQLAESVRPVRPLRREDGVMPEQEADRQQRQQPQPRQRACDASARLKDHRPDDTAARRQWIAAYMCGW